MRLRSSFGIEPVSLEFGEKAVVGSSSSGEEGFIGRAAVGYDAEVNYLGLTLDPAYIEDVAALGVAFRRHDLVYFGPAVAAPPEGDS